MPAGFIQSRLRTQVRAQRRRQELAQCSGLLKRLEPLEHSQVSRPRTLNLDKCFERAGIADQCVLLAGLCEELVNTKA